MPAPRPLTALLACLLILGSPFLTAPNFTLAYGTTAPLTSPTMPEDEDDAAQHAPAKNLLPCVRRHVEPRHAPASPSITSHPHCPATPASARPVAPAPFRAAVNPPLHC
jgi:hypothetical protein